MSYLRFNYVFFAMMLLSGICAFLVPSEKTIFIRGRADVLLAPVTTPVRRIAVSVSRGDEKDRPADGSTKDLEQLRSTIVSLSSQLEELRRLNANRDLAGEIQRYSTPFRISGADSSGRDGLTLLCSSDDALLAGMPAVHRNGFVGKLTSVGPRAAQLRLATDRGFRVRGAFGRLEKSSDGKPPVFRLIDTPQPLVEGQGNGTMTITNLHMAQVKSAGLKTGDLVLLHDPDEPPILSGQLLGEIESIREWSKQRLFAEITIRPRINLNQLNEVMIVTGKDRKRTRP